MGGKTNGAGKHKPVSGIYRETGNWTAPSKKGEKRREEKLEGKTRRQRLRNRIFRVAGNEWD